jgi:hypothetical protein
MTKNVKELKKDLEQLRKDFIEETQYLIDNPLPSTQGNYKSKIEKLKGQISKLEIQIDIQDFRLWKLENPFKFEVGELVKIPSSYDNNIYKVINREFYKIINTELHNKLYELFDCKNNVKKTAREGQLELYIKEK